MTTETTPQRCGTCRHYFPIPGDPPAGWCHWRDVTDLPFWLEDAIGSIKSTRLGDDVLATDGADCRVYGSELEISNAT